MSRPDPEPPIRDQFLREAAAWFARMRGPEAEASREEFEKWLKRGALHRQAYNRAAEIFAMGKVLAEEGDASPSAQPGPERRHRRLAWAAMSALLVLAAAGWFALGAIVPGEAPKFQIADKEAPDSPGQRLAAEDKVTARTVRLADGSTLILRPGAVVDVRLTASERRLRLERGQARFQVAHDRRPFTVFAGQGRVTARGTLFDVALSPDRRVMVRLIEGAVDVSFPRRSPDAAEPVIRRLRPGETISFPLEEPARAQRSATPARAETVETRASISAPDVTRDFESISIAELVAAANRRAERPIRLAEPAIGDRRVSGRFRIDDTALLAQRLASLFDLNADLDDRREIVLHTQ
jgi:transmembrane sensor